MLSVISTDEHFTFFFFLLNYIDLCWKLDLQDLALLLLLSRFSLALIF